MNLPGTDNYKSWPITFAPLNALLKVVARQKLPPTRSKQRTAKIKCEPKVYSSKNGCNSEKVAGIEWQKAK